MSSNLQYLLEMGFSQDLAEKALQATGGENIETAMDWIIAHSENDNRKDDKPQEDEINTESQETSPQDDSPLPKSLKCDECNKLFRTHEEVEFHAAKTNHSQFSESTEEKKPLTDEEKKEQLKKIEELIKQKRKEREEKEKADQVEQEKKRIQSGKELSQIRKKLQDEEIRKLAEERKREKEEEKMARQRVKEQIEQDKLARKMKFGVEGSQKVEQVTPKVQTVPVATPAKEYKETRIQIRLTNGTTLTQSFGVKEQLAAVRLYIEMNRTDPPGEFKLQTSFPRRVFELDDYEKPLDILGLVPSSVLIVSKV